MNLYIYRSILWWNLTRHWSFLLWCGRYVTGTRDGCCRHFDSVGKPWYH